MESKQNILYVGTFDYEHIKLWAYDRGKMELLMQKKHSGLEPWIPNNIKRIMVQGDDIYLIGPWHIYASPEDYQNGKVLVERKQQYICGVAFHNGVMLDSDGKNIYRTLEDPEGLHPIYETNYQRCDRVIGVHALGSHNGEAFASFSLCSILEPGEDYTEWPKEEIRKDLSRAGIVKVSDLSQIIAYRQSHVSAFYNYKGELLDQVYQENPYNQSGSFRTLHDKFDDKPAIPIQNDHQIGGLVDFEDSMLVFGPYYSVLWKMKQYKFLNKRAICAQMLGYVEEKIHKELQPYIFHDFKNETISAIALG